MSVMSDMHECLGDATETRHTHRQSQPATLDLLCPCVLICACEHRVELRQLRGWTGLRIA